MQRTDLQCDVRHFSYDFEARKGRLDMALGNCCDMYGCIALFERIDPSVKQIQTFAGGEVDTAYVKRAIGWIAVLHE